MAEEPCIASRIVEFRLSHRSIGASRSAKIGVEQSNPWNARVRSRKRMSEQVRHRTLADFAGAEGPADDLGPAAPW